MPGFLVIGYGNTLRRDDGVGPRVAERIAALGLPGVQAMACALLTPELAEAVARARVVVFVDAAVNGSPQVQLRSLEPAGPSRILAHAADPRGLLTQAHDLFGRAPPAWWLTIPVQDLGIGEELSALARRGLEIAVEEVLGLARAAGFACAGTGS